jgi:hypothetical protein
MASAGKVFLLFIKPYRRFFVKVQDGGEGNSLSDFFSQSRYTRRKPNGFGQDARDVMKRMLVNFIYSQVRKNRDLILHEARYVEGFMQLLMKQRNSGEKWTFRERIELKGYIKRLVGYIPVLCIFLLPGGFFMIPLLAEVMDRREKSRRARETTPKAGTAAGS